VREYAFRVYSNRHYPSVWYTSPVRTAIIRTNNAIMTIYAIYIAIISHVFVHRLLISCLCHELAA
jgi:hypothetical protein